MLSSSYKLLMNENPSETERNQDCYLERRGTLSLETNK